MTGFFMTIAFTRKTSRLSALTLGANLQWLKRIPDYFFFLTAFALGKSVIEPSKISAAKPIDSFKVG